MNTEPGMNFVTFSLILDDIVFPDGQTAMGVLGGGGPQTAFGLRLWAEQVGLAAGVGTDLPVAALDRLTQLEIDTAGLRRSEKWPTPRAWQVLEADGRRTQVWRVPGPAIGAQLGRRFDVLPPEYRQARGYHVGIHPEAPDLEFLAALRQTGAWVSVEPFRAAQRSLAEPELRALLSAGQIFSPNQTEAESLVGAGEPAELVRRLAAAGAEIVALRLGPTGALVHRAKTGETWCIPTVDVVAVDPTGAGNAFCGGFLAGWALTDNLRAAGLYGAVAASFLVEQVGLPTPGPDVRQEARRRLDAVSARAEQVL